MIFEQAVIFYIPVSSIYPKTPDNRQFDTFWMTYTRPEMYIHFEAWACSNALIILAETIYQAENRSIEVALGISGNTGA